MKTETKGKCLAEASFTEKLSLKTHSTVSMRERVTSLKNRVIRRAARRRVAITNLLSITTTSARKAATRRDHTRMMTTAISTKTGMKNIMDTKKSLAKKVDLTTTKSGDTKKEKVIKSLNTNLLM